MSTCPHCGYENSGASICPLCGTATVAPGAAQSAGSLAPVGPVGHWPEWEDSAHSFPRNLFQTWRRSVFEPTAFFRDVPYDRPATRPVLYYLIISLVAAMFALWWNAVFATANLGLMSQYMEGFDLAGAGGSAAAGAVLNFFLAPFGAVIGLIVWTGILHLFVLMLAKKRRAVGATVRVISYATGPLIVGIVPFVGGFVGSIWSLVLTIIGIREAHRTTTGAAAAIVLLPVALLFGLILVVFIVLLAAIASMGL